MDGHNNPFFSRVYEKSRRKPIFYLAVGGIFKIWCMEFTVSIPATSANIGPGFDVWGIAFGLRNRFTAVFSEQIPQIQRICNLEFIPGELVLQTTAKNDAINLENNDNNLICKSYFSLFEKAGFPPEKVFVKVHVEIPLERGLGSSSTAILAGMIIANEIMRKKHSFVYTMDDIFQFASTYEGHPDNIGPALYGGWINSMKINGKYVRMQIPLKAPVKIMGIIPHRPLLTSKAREVVPASLSMEDVTFHTSRTGALGYLLSRPEWNASEAELFRVAMDDVIHQNQRADYIPGMKETFRYWKDNGAYGAYLSGAGTTLLGFWPMDMDEKKLDLSRKMKEMGVDATGFFPRIDGEGAILEI